MNVVETFHPTVERDIASVEDWCKSYIRRDKLNHNALAKEPCIICKRKGIKVNDHDHKSGTNRGTICQRCNMALGLFGDNPEIIGRAFLYLAYWKEKDKKAA